MKNKIFRKFKLSQYIIDYAVLIALVCMSLIAVSGYIFRSVDKRVEHIWQDLYDPQNGVK